jgi:hypothetical protein
LLFFVFSSLNPFKGIVAFEYIGCSGVIRIGSKLYGTKYGPEDVNDCDGCRTEGGRLFSGCKTCLIRNCAKDKGLENCACCSEYACEQLLKFFAMEPEAKERLNRIKSKRK